MFYDVSGMFYRIWGASANFESKAPGWIGHLRFLFIQICEFLRFLRKAHTHALVSGARGGWAGYCEIFLPESGNISYHTAVYHKKSFSCNLFAQITVMKLKKVFHPKPA